MTVEELVERLKETPSNYKVVAEVDFGSREILAARIDTQLEEVSLIIRSRKTK